MAVRKISAKEKKPHQKAPSKREGKSRFGNPDSPSLRKEIISIKKRRKSLQAAISTIPAEKLQEVEQKIEEVLSSTKIKSTGPKSLAGIWAGKGFENIDIEKEIRAARDAMQKQILDRHLRNELHS